ncbi:class I SAM-dependent methyltransferase [Amycolatopsis sp. 195334CR]|uniref:class I SAM-dependent methyltransferase n=1 Tax=Amycolatopsis sp. 195334CR TaxID=2814588 RepID=UPI001A902124|nr:class I SAM-dependent methyltransferase [Amycolatopsis sp. 195334CR]MBN6038955.1 class I SAM-dependent methyltransferase [Amycolatopsis sp. 195334CR]
MDDRPITVAQRNFRRHADELERMGNQERFTYIFESNLWASDSVSGPGSEADQTAGLRAGLPGLLARFEVRTLLDLPCGDFGWLSEVELGVERYIGADIVEDLVARNTARYGRDREFRVLDLTTDDLPMADAVLCRDCLVHLSDDDIRLAIANLRRSGSRYLLTTHFGDTTANTDISTGDWRPLNLCLAPFSFPEPLAVLLEGCTEEGGAYTDKALALWEISSLPG